MIVPMKKVYLILLDAWREESLTALKELGVVHLEDCSGSSDALEALRERRDRVQQALIGLADADGAAPKELTDPEAKVDEILQLLAEKKETQERINRLVKEEEALKGWGDFDPAQVRFLHDEGVEVQLLQIPKKAAPSLKERKNAWCIDDSGLMHRYALIDDTGDLPPEAHPFPLPQQSLSALRETLQENHSRLSEIDAALAAETAARKALEAFRRELEEEIRFEEVRAGVGTEEELVHLHGFVPQNRTEELKAAAAEHGWGLMLREPEAHEYVPTLVERKGPVRLAKPIFDLMGTLPGYREFDISLIFLSAFTIFVAMIVGDAGYGMIFLALAFWGLAKAPESAKLPLKLTVLLSSAIVIWGAITGTWFGSETIASWGPLNNLVVPQIASFPAEGINSVKAVQLLCFIIGIVQLSLARIEMFVRTLPRLKAFEHLGWLALLWGLFFLALNIVLGITSWLNVEFTPLIVPLAIAGFALIVLFSNQKGRFFRDMLAGLNPINLLLNFLDGVSSFSNIISYIRLFAVGLSSVAVAASFNAMALSIGFDGPQAVGAVLMLIIGHALNIILALMSIIVHGIRLNMLEYSGQLGLEWSGYAYEPFAKSAA
jgi:V/A-type H+-transporting ATPase subunit I